MSTTSSECEREPSEIEKKIFILCFYVELAAAAAAARVVVPVYLRTPLVEFLFLCFCNF